MFEQLLASGTLKPKPPFGFIGEVPAADFITGTDFAALVGLTAGTAINSNTPWLEFVDTNGVTKLISKLRIRVGAAWNTYNGLGLVTGRIITIKGKSYRARMLTSNAGGADRVDLTGEYDRLLYSILAGRPASYSGPIFANYPIADLGFAANIWEHTATESGTSIFSRGNPLINRGSTPKTSTGGTVTYYRPILDRLS